MAPPTILVQNRRKFVSRDQAIQDLVNHHNRMISSPSELEAAAIRRLHSAVKKAKAENIVKLVKDLDVVFFGGVLLGHIDVSWGGPVAFRSYNKDANDILGSVICDSPRR